MDGNKRLALTSVAVFFTLNRYLFYVSQEEAIAFALKVALSEGSSDLKEISRWLRRHSIRNDALLAMPIADQRRWFRNVPSQDLRHLLRLVQIPGEFRWQKPSFLENR